MDSRNNDRQVRHPSHYVSHPSGIECIEVNKHMDYNIGNAFKYVYRNEEKHDNPLIDLEKAVQYIDFELDLRSHREDMAKVTSLAARMADASPKYQGDAIFELWLASLDWNDKEHLKNARDTLVKELERRAIRNGLAGPDR